MTDKTPAVAYLRSAVHDSEAIEEQRQVCLRYASAQGWTILDWIVDNGVGGHRDRSGLAALREVVREQCASVVLALNVARISRDMDLFDDFAGLCAEHGVRIAFADGSTPTSDVVPLVKRLAEREREDRMARSRRLRRIGAS